MYTFAGSSCVDPSEEVADEVPSPDTVPASNTVLVLLIRNVVSATVVATILSLTPPAFANVSRYTKAAESTSFALPTAA